MNVASFFDVDGTLVPAPSLEKRFLRYLRWRGLIGWHNYLRCAAPLLRDALRSIFGGGRDGAECVAARCKTYLAGVPVAALDEWLAWSARHAVALLPYARRRIAWHAKQGHRIFFISGTLEPLARAFAQSIAFPVEVCATQLETENGLFTGRLRGEAPCGPAKARAMEALAGKFPLDLGRSFAYGNSFADRWMLAQVGNPFVVQTTNTFSRSLARLAQTRRWPVLAWSTAAARNGKTQHRDTEDTEEHTDKRNILAAWVRCG